MNLLEWLRKALTVWRGIFSFLICLVFSSVLLSLDRPERRVFHEVMVGTVFYPVQSVLSRFDGTARVYRENERLRGENAALRTENDLLNQYLRQTARLAEMETYHLSASLRLKAGRIIAEDAGRPRMTWVLNLGRTDSVDVNMPVITARGIVGKIAKCFQNHSLVQLLSDPAFKVAVQAERGRARGIMGANDPYRLAARFPAGSDVLPGDTLVTSGLGGVFPKGLRVGVVSRELPETEEQNGGVIRSFLVDPFQSLNTVEEAFVLIKQDQWSLKEVP